MTGKKETSETVASLTEDIATKAGLPRAEGTEHSLHAAGDTASHKVESGLDAAGKRASEATDDARKAVERGTEKASEASDNLRGKLSETVDSVRETAADLSDRASGAYDDARSWASDRYDHHRRRAGALADRGYDSLDRGRAATGDFVSENPLLVGVVGLAAGLLLGALLPRTRSENQALGPWADEVRDQGLRYARDATRQGRAFVERALDPENLDAAVQEAGKKTGPASAGNSRRAQPS